MSGALTPEGTPTLLLNIAGQNWVAVIDTGFDGDLELPDVLAQHFPGVSLGPQKAILAGGVVVTDEIFLIDFPFDGETLSVETSFGAVTEVLIGTGLLKDYRLEIDFPAGTVELTRLQGP